MSVRSETLGEVIDRTEKEHIMDKTDTDNTQIDKRVECVVLLGDRRSGVSCGWANATKETDK